MKGGDKIIRNVNNVGSYRENEVGIVVSNYLEALGTACWERTIDRKLTLETKALLEQKLIPNEVNIREVKKHVDSILVNANLKMKQEGETNA
ncbi:MAG: hypothetical protein ABFC84_17725 [Veillonellales bacterium]